jgi:ribosomal protein L16/L10AE
MQGAFGKPQGTVARIHIGQVIMSIHIKLKNKDYMTEALHRAMFKFPVTRGAASQRNGALPSLMQMNLKHGG